MQANDPIIVEAFDLSSVFGALSKAVSGMIDKNDIAGSILQIIADGLITMYGGVWWGLASAILNYGFGINIKTVWTALKRVFTSFFKSGKAQSVTPANLDSVADGLTKQTMSLIPLPEDKADKPLAEIFEESPEILSTGSYYNNGELVKVAFGIGTIAGWIGELTTKGFFDDLLENTIKALLKGAGVGIVGSSAAKGLGLGGGGSAGTTSTALPPDTSVPPTTQGKKIDVMRYIGTPSGKGQSEYANDADENGDGEKMWMLPNNTGTFEELMFGWFEKIYSNCPTNLKSIIYKNFNQAAATVRKQFEKFNANTDIDSVGAYIRVPNNFTNVKQIVDSILSIFVAK